jgi:hypothetical protein
MAFTCKTAIRSGSPSKVSKTENRFVNDHRVAGTKIHDVVKGISSAWSDWRKRQMRERLLERLRGTRTKDKHKPLLKAAAYASGYVAGNAAQYIERLPGIGRISNPDRPINLDGSSPQRTPLDVNAEAVNRL